MTIETSKNFTEADREALADQCRRNANLFRLPAHPALWPDWMTPEKRNQMADSFERAAAELSSPPPGEETRG